MAERFHCKRCWQIIDMHDSEDWSERTGTRCCDAEVEYSSYHFKQGAQEPLRRIGYPDQDDQ